MYLNNLEGDHHSPFTAATRRSSANVSHIGIETRKQNLPINCIIKDIVSLDNTYDNP